MVLLWISTVVSPRGGYELLVVTVRVTLQPVSRAAAKRVKNTNFVIADDFFRSTTTNNIQQFFSFKVSTDATDFGTSEA